ncbi:hypothetical protein A5819_003564 [Enterococcus sp. 7E2_DIV0204]|uniref:DUF916 and DUF3324 domain-containing protein n=1 Tax=unclassified Enterococcus TaxID=2608891 RepID=UPI000A34A66B|nr:MULTISPECIES: DUF916 and DUF3324 domain-containing protein [unclassified Enterococcus]OTN84014.1 hypothetical protein A5819_003564 [Enterococcus sp. 7E2_DIV0204]OTP47208.1 hypothetical protein A5884_003583 [Enterococcus sp. 7D2_DIV0200]
MKSHIVLTKQYLSIFFSVMVTCCFFLQAVPGYTKDVSPAGATGFTYSINYPDNQVDKELGYYKLKMISGQKQQLEIALSNPSDEKVTIDVKINGAKTNQNGVIEYGDSTIKSDPSLKFDFMDIVKAPESVELAPGETKNVELMVEMPETGYDGVIAGGIQLMRAGQADKQNDGSGSMVINQYAYVIAMLLQETDTKVTPDLSLNSVQAGQTNYRNTIFVNFSNVMAAYLDNMTVEVQLTQKGKETVLYERKQTAMRMAPNSFIDFPISMNGERMVPGDYEANILVTSGEKKWSWKESFKITNEDANKFNERDVGLVQEKKVDWRLILLLVVAFLLIILTIFYVLRFLRKKKKSKESAMKKSRKKRKKKIQINK